MERRHEERVPLELRVRYQASDVEPSSERDSKNLSASGVFIRCPKPLEVGRELRIEIEIAPAKIVRVRGRVAWSRRPDPRQRELSPGMGIEFIEVSDSDRAELAHLFAAHVPAAEPTLAASDPTAITAPLPLQPKPAPAEPVSPQPLQAKRTILGMPVVLPKPGNGAGAKDHAHAFAVPVEEVTAAAPASTATTDPGLGTPAQPRPVEAPPSPSPSPSASPSPSPSPSPSASPIAERRDPSPSPRAMPAEPLTPTLSPSGRGPVRDALDSASAKRSPASVEPTVETLVAPRKPLVPRWALVSVLALIVIAIVVAAVTLDREGPPRPVPAPGPPAHHGESEVRPLPSAPPPPRPAEPAGPSSSNATPAAAATPAPATPAPATPEPAPSTTASAPSPSGAPALPPGADPLLQARAWIEEGRTQDAIPVLLDAIASGAPPAAHSLLGQAYEKQGDRQAAIEEYRRFIAARPNLPEANRLQRRIQYLSGPGR